MKKLLKTVFDAIMSLPEMIIAIMGFALLFALPPLVLFAIYELWEYFRGLF